jgi:hypothetical protein
MMDEFIHWPKPSLLLSAICDGILACMIKIFDEKTLGKYVIPPKNYKE